MKHSLGSWPGTNGSNNSNSSQGPQSLMMPISMLHCAWQFVSDFFAAKDIFFPAKRCCIFHSKSPCWALRPSFGAMAELDQVGEICGLSW